MIWQHTPKKHCLGNLEEMLYQYYIHSDVEIRFKSSASFYLYLED